MKLERIGVKFMYLLAKVAVLGVALFLASCHKNGSFTENHDANGNSLMDNGEICIKGNDINIYGIIVSSSTHDTLLEKLGFDSAVSGVNVYTTHSDRGPNIGIHVTDTSNCLLFLGTVSRTELARMLGIKTFSGME